MIAPRLRGSVMPSTRPAAASALRDDLLEQVLRVRVLVRRHLERDALVHAVEAGHAVELGAGDLHHGDAALGHDRQHLLDASSISTRWAM
jgi:hypothetical protein